MINQCRLGYNNAKDTNKYWYKAKIKRSCRLVARNLSSISGNDVLLKTAVKAKICCDRYLRQRFVSSDY